MLPPNPFGSRPDLRDLAVVGMTNRLAMPPETDHVTGENAQDWIICTQSPVRSVLTPTAPTRQR